jgi:hypothetical protein
MPECGGWLWHFPSDLRQQESAFNILIRRKLPYQEKHEFRRGGMRLFRIPRSGITRRAEYQDGPRCMVEGHGCKARAPYHARPTAHLASFGRPGEPVRALGEEHDLRQLHLLLSRRFARNGVRALPDRGRSVQRMTAYSQLTRRGQVPMERFEAKGARCAQRFGNLQRLGSSQADR